MNVNATLSFLITHRDGPDLALGVITPIVNDIPLTALVTEFENEEQFDCIGGYGGLVPELTNLGAIDRYYLADFEPGSYYPNYGGINLLGCQCGEVGCWPLKCQVKVEGHTVTWHNFTQPHRADRSYWRFGPFVFDLAQYKQAVRDLCANLDARLAGNGLDT